MTSPYVRPDPASGTKWKVRLSAAKDLEPAASSRPLMPRMIRGPTDGGMQRGRPVGSAPCPSLNSMKTIALGTTGWAEVQADGSFRMSLRGSMSQEDAVRLARWVLARVEGQGGQSPIDDRV